MDHSTVPKTTRPPKIPTTIAELKALVQPISAERRYESERVTNSSRSITKSLHTEPVREVV